MSNDFYIPPRKTLKWLMVDLDGTLAYSTWHADQKRSVVGDPIPENVEKLRAAYAKGYKAIIHTARHWMDYELIQKWLLHHDIPHEGIICGKPLAHKYIDDRGVNAREDKWV